ncbi:unnamed protein product [Spirodela intermedia]|uniref:Uncharacterized protein n=1 Tax=Spirodela intermedia TaxID=51605 RepID=A0A7I8IYK0_SPIIN|nr:unnamed protein product [Spirodela intermedia]CAA6662653.1 unnamed protein product [Spirodela intermedia]
MIFFSKLSVPSLSSFPFVSCRRTNFRSSAASASNRLFFRYPRRSPCAVAASNFPYIREIGRRPLLSPRPQFQSPPQCLISSWRSISEMASASAQSPKSVHDFTVKLQRKALLIVNVASQCGLTNSNYTELSQLYEKYKSKDPGFPMQPVWGQEPGSNDQIVEFACTRFKAEYPIFDKVDVNGQNAAPVYKFLKSSKGGSLGTASSGTSPSSWSIKKGIPLSLSLSLSLYPSLSLSRLLKCPFLFLQKDIKKILGEA